MHTKLITTFLAVACAFASTACIAEEAIDDGYLDDQTYDDEDGEEVGQDMAALTDGGGYGKLTRSACMAAAVDLYNGCKSDEQTCEQTPYCVWLMNKCEDDLARHVAWCKANTVMSGTGGTTVVSGGGLKLSP